jgi:hypothetical protein
MKVVHSRTSHLPNITLELFPYQALYNSNEYMKRCDGFTYLEKLVVSDMSLMLSLLNADSDPSSNSNSKHASSIT